MVDGIRLSNSTFRYGPNQYLATVAPHSIERVEVVRGSGSTLYGSDAIGGVVNVLSRGPRFTGGKTAASARVLLRGMTDAMDRTARAEGEVAGERWALYAGADVRSFGDLVAGGDLGTAAPSGYDERSADAKALVRASSSTVLTLAYQSLRQSDVPRWDQVAQRGYLRYGFDPQERQLAYARSQTFFSHRWLRQSRRPSRSRGRSRAASGSAGGRASRSGRGTRSRRSACWWRPAPSRARGGERPRESRSTTTAWRARPSPPTSATGVATAAPGPLPGRRDGHEPRRLHPALARPRAGGPDPGRAAQLLRDRGGRPGGRADRRPAAGARGQRLGALTGSRRGSTSSRRSTAASGPRTSATSAASAPSTSASRSPRPTWSPRGR